MTGLGMQFDDATVTYDAETTAVDRVSLTWEANRIHGLLGRNGAGKTTLLSLLGALRTPTSGSVRIDGADPFENAPIMESVCLIRESGDVLGDEKLSVNLDFQELARPTFDREYAEVLLEAFGLSPKKKVDALSRGQASAVGVVVGLASRAPVTIFDEVHLGMDAPSRQLFYDAMLADFSVNPRTLILSSHLISEIENLLDTVTILQRGGLLLHAEAEDLRERGLTMTGPTAAIEALLAEYPLTVIGRRHLGPTTQVTLFGDLPESAVASAQRRGMSVGAVPLQDLFIHLTDTHSAQARLGEETS